MSDAESEKRIRSSERALWFTAFAVGFGFVALITAIVLLAGHFSTTDENEAAHAWKDAKPYGLTPGVCAVCPAMAVSAGAVGQIPSLAFSQSRDLAFFRFRGLVPAECVGVACLVKTPAGAESSSPAGCNQPEAFLSLIRVLPPSGGRVGEISRPRPVLKTLKGIPATLPGANPRAYAG